MRWLVFFILLALLVASCTPKTQSSVPQSDFVERLYASDPARQMIGARLPSISFTDLVSKEKVSLDKLKGVVLINSLILGCPSCLEEIPKLNQLHDTYGDKLTIIQVDINPKDTQEQLMKVKQEIHGQDYVWTISPEAGKALNMSAPDVTYIVKNGKIVYGDSMVVPVERLDRFVQEALK